MNSMARIACALAVLSLVAAASLASARSGISITRQSRMLTQQQQANASATAPAPPQNCTPPYPLEATALPFCFQPNSVSPEARAYLAKTAAGAAQALAAESAPGGSGDSNAGSYLQHLPVPAAVVVLHLPSCSSLCMTSVLVPHRQQVHGPIW